MPHYAPVTGGPPGHNLKDNMFPWTSGTTPESVLDISAMGYKYQESRRQVSKSTIEETISKLRFPDKKIAHIEPGCEYAE